MDLVTLPLTVAVYADHLCKLARHDLRALYTKVARWRGQHVNQPRPSRLMAVVPAVLTVMMAAVAIRTATMSKCRGNATSCNESDDQCENNLLHVDPPIVRRTS